MKRAGLYLRVSMGDQHAENQRPAEDELARARGLKEVLVEEEAASTRGRRPAFERVMVAARAHRFDVLIIWAIDRFGRSMAGNLGDVLELDRLGVVVLSVREPWLEAPGPTRSLLVAIFSWVAEQEREQRSERTKAGLARVKKTGITLGRPRRSVNVTAALSMKAEGKTWPQVARALGASRSVVLRAVKASLAAAGDA